MKTFLFSLLCLCSVLSYSQDGISGKYELFDDSKSKLDTLSNGVIITRKEVLQKMLTLKSNGSFTNKHLQPAGFAASLDYAGNWTIEGDVITLSYTVSEENENGQPFQAERSESFTLEGSTLFNNDPKLKTHIYHRIE